MTPLDLLAAVLPSPGNGHYCAVELTNKKEHVFGKTLEEIMPTVERWAGKGYDTYFALGTFGTNANRTKDNMHASQVLAVDIDCNHPKDVPDEDGVIKDKAYPSAKAAAQALQKFCEDTGLNALGEPWLVASGGGVHAYWPLDRLLFKEDWYPLARRFKELCFKYGLAIDPAITSDASRILRVPDSVNTGIKNGKAKRAATRVRFVSEGDRFSVDEIDAILTAEGFGADYVKLPATSTLTLPGQRATSVTSSSALSKALTQNSTTLFKKLMVKTKEGSGCAQLQNYVENASEDGMEPVWRGVLSWAKVCDDGEKASIWLSDLHPYDHERMHMKLNEIKGPYSCAAMDEAQPGICRGCPHWGKITNPLIWGREIAVVTEAMSVEVEAPADEEEDTVDVLLPEPPRGYAYGKRGGVFAEKVDEDAEGKKVTRQILLCAQTLYPIDILNNNGNHEVHFGVIRDKHVREVLLPQKSIASKDEIIKGLANQNVMAAFGSGNDKNFADYIRACVEKLSVERNPIKVPTSFGWQDDGSFVYGGKVYAPQSRPFLVPMQDLGNVVNNTQATGALDDWRKIVDMLIRRKMWDQLAVMMASAAAPLMGFTGLFGCTVHVASTESGTGKSLSLDAGASIWGHPVHYRTGSGTSAVAMQQRLGLLRSLPLVTDEITTNNRKDFEWFPAFLFSMSEGRGKERMESGTNRERLNLSIWATLAIMSSNRGAVDYLAGSRDHASEGELRRLIEFSMDQKLDWTQDEITIIKSLHQNYGVAGEVYVQYLVDHAQEVKELTNKCVSKMYEEFGAASDERYWMATVGCVVAACVLFNRQHAGIADIPVTEVIEAYRRQVETQRACIKGNKRTAEDVLNYYIQEYQGKFVIVKYGDKASPAAMFGDGTTIGRGTTRSEVMGRAEHGTSHNCIDFYIEERLLRSFCSNMSFSYNTFKEDIAKHFLVNFVPKKDMMSRTEGPPMRVATIRISMPTNSIDDVVFQTVPVAVS